MLTIKKLNNTYIQLLTDNQSLLWEVADRFSFPIEGRKYHPLVKARKWDGIIRLFDKNSGKLYLGLLPDLMKLVKKTGDEYEIDPALRDTARDISEETIESFINSIPLSANGVSIQPYDYQISALKIGIRNSRATLIAATSAGKSLIIYLYIRWLLENSDKTILLLVPSVQLVYQMNKDFRDYSSQDPSFISDDYIQIVHDDAVKNIEKRIIIVNSQALRKVGKEWYEAFDVVIHDEVHRVKAMSFKTIMENCVNCDTRLGLTGTLDRVEVNELSVKGLIGKTHNVIDTKTLVEEGHATPLTVKIYKLKYPAHIIPRLRPGDYKAEMDYLCAVPERKEFLYKLLNRITGNTLIIFTFVDNHLIPMYEEYLTKQTGKVCHVISGTTPQEEREDIRAILEKTDDNIVFCSYGTMSTGINIRNLKNLIFATGSKSVIRVKQTLGRMLRKNVFKDRAYVYDIVDDLREKSAGIPNSSYLHGKERYKFYKEDGHEILYQEIKIE